MSQVYCRRCEAPLEFGASLTNLCERCDPHLFVPPSPTAADGSLCAHCGKQHLWTSLGGPASYPASKEPLTP